MYRREHEYGAHRLAPIHVAAAEESRTPKADWTAYPKRAVAGPPRAALFDQEVGVGVRPAPADRPEERGEGQESPRFLCPRGGTPGRPRSRGPPRPGEAPPGRRRGSCRLLAASSTGPWRGVGAGRRLSGAPAVPARRSAKRKSRPVLPVDQHGGVDRNWLGCDLCEAWFKVTKAVHDTWSDVPFSCRDFGHVCQERPVGV